MAADWVSVVVFCVIGFCAAAHILLCNILVQWLRVRRGAHDAVTNQDFLHWWLGRMRALVQPIYSRVMRSKNLHEVDPAGVYLGDFPAAGNKHHLQKLGITHVVTVIIGVPPLFQDDFDYKLVPIRDSPEVDIRSYLTECCKYIDAALEQNGRVKVSCCQTFIVLFHHSSIFDSRSTV
jgi:hypothetical protein